MKVAQVYSRYYPHVGGVETVMKEVSERLAQKGVDIEVLTQDGLGKCLPTESINGGTVRRFAPGPLGWDFAFRSGSLRNFLKMNANKYDIIHAHSYQAFPALYAAWSKRETKLVFNAHYHSGKGSNLLRTLLHIPYRRIGRVIFDKADRIICVSQTEKSRIERHFPVPDEKIVVIPNGVNTDEIARVLPFPFDGKLLLYVGRLDRYKNIHLAIRAIPYLPPEYKFVIVGSGSYKAKLSQLVEELRLADRVQIISGLSNEEVYRWYKTCDLVLSFSSYEAFGLTVIEGLAAGKPVLVNNEPALAELATKFDQAYVVEAERLSPLQLAREMELWCGSKASIPDLEAYSWDSIAGRIKELYESLL